MGKSPVEVYVRCRPTFGNASSLKVADDYKAIAVNLPKHEVETGPNNQADRLNFKFKQVLDGMSQEDVFTTTASELLDTVLMGYNGTIFTYGQTGAGKTFTLSGDTENYSQRGIIPRAVHYLFQEIDMREDREVSMKASYLEIYNEALYDLISENPGEEDNNLIVVDEGGVASVKGLRKKVVTNEEEALATFFQGEGLRSTASHMMNSNSSRSHCVFTLHLEIRAGADEKVSCCKVNFVDLAGSERTKKTNATGQMMKEAMYINRSLSFLEQTVNALAKKENHVPFRQSKLTAVLRDALGGNCKTVLIGCVWGEDTHVEETVSTLRFATRVKSLMTNLSITSRNDPTLLLRKYERQIKELKMELMMRDTLSGRNVSYEDLGDLEKTELRQMVQQFIAGEIALEDMSITNLKQIKETYAQFKAVYQTLQLELQEQMANGKQDRGEVAGDAARAEADTAEQPADDIAVGDADMEQSSFHIGVAPAHLRPEVGEDDVADETGPLSPETMAKDTAKLDISSSDDKHTAFETYKVSHRSGKELSSALKSMQADVKDKKRLMRQMAMRTNDVKRAIDNHTATLALLKGDATGQAEEVELTKTLKKAKLDYRAAFKEVKEIKDDISTLEESINSTRVKLVEGFEAWFASRKAGGASPTKGAPVPAVTEVAEEDFDQEEKFERLNMERIMSTDPESSAFLAARKSLVRGTAGAKQFGGEKSRALQTRKLEVNAAR